jgi:hypothetical protein
VTPGQAIRAGLGNSVRWTPEIEGWTRDDGAYVMRSGPLWIPFDADGDVLRDLNGIMRDFNAPEAAMRAVDERWP